MDLRYVVSVYDNSGNAIQMYERTFQLPFVPFPGLRISIGDDNDVLEVLPVGDVVFNLKTGTFETNWTPAEFWPSDVLDRQLPCIGFTKTSRVTLPTEAAQ